MFFVPRRQIWTQQPQGELTLDKSNPLASTITHCLPLNGSVREIVNGGKLSLASTGAFDVSQIGRSLQGSGAACASIPINLSGYTKLTVSFLMYWDAFANDDKLAMEYGSNFATNSGFLIDPNSSSGSFEAGVASPGLFNSWKCTRPSAAAWHHYYITLNRTTGTAQSSTIAIDGVIQAMTVNNSSSNVTDNFGNNSLYLFSRNNASLFGLGRMANLIIRGGYVGTVPEAKQEFENPWQIFKRPDSRIFVPVSAGGGTATVTSDSAASYKVQGSVQSSAAAGYNIRAAIQQDAASAYSIRGSIQQSSAAAYLIRALVDQTVTASYGIRTAVSNDASATYNILSATSVSASTSAGYSIRGSVDQTTSASYALRGSVAQDTSATYSILSASSVTSSVTAGYAIKGSVQSSIVAGYSIAQAVQAEIAASYIIRSGVVSEAQAVFVKASGIYEQVSAVYVKQAGLYQPAVVFVKQTNSWVQL